MQRLLTAAVGTFVALASLFLMPAWGWFLVVAVVIDWAAVEYLHIVRPLAPRAPVAILVALVPLATGVWCWFRLHRIDPGILAVSAFTAVAAQIGDLVESLIKRGTGVKDSGTVLPGHGGMLDRLDAMLFAAPVLLFGLWLL